MTKHIRVKSLEEFKIITELYKVPWVRTTDPSSLNYNKIPTNEEVYSKVGPIFVREHWLCIKIYTNEKEWNNDCSLDADFFKYLEFEDVVNKIINCKKENFFMVNL